MSRLPNQPPTLTVPERSGCRIVTAFAVALGFAASSASAGDWPTASPAEVGFAPDLGGQLDAALAGPAGVGVHAVVLIRDGKLVYERYLSGDDEIYGRRKLGVVFGPGLLHDVRSISKSVVSLLYGIALEEDTVPSLDDPVIAAFPEYPDLSADPDREGITVDDLLSMTLGVVWNEDLPYSDPENSEIAMNRAPDSLRFALDRPLVTEPGTDWTYNGGTTGIAATLIARGNGGDLVAFANARLFAPLGIDHYQWITDYYGRPYAASGLRLRPRDTARIGQLVLDDGAWEGEQIVPAEWIGTSTAKQAEADFECGYGYQWWLCPLTSGLRLVEGAGWGGQELLVLPQHRIVLVVNAGLYGDPEAYRRAFDLLEETVIPAIQDP